MAEITHARVVALYESERAKHVCRRCGAYNDPAAAACKRCELAGFIEPLTHNEALQGARTHVHQEIRDNGTPDHIAAWKIVEQLVKSTELEHDHEEAIHLALATRERITVAEARARGGK